MVSRPGGDLAFPHVSISAIPLFCILRGDFYFPSIFFAADPCLNVQQQGLLRCLVNHSWVIARSVPCFPPIRILLIVRRIPLDTPIVNLRPAPNLLTPILVLHFREWVLIIGRT